MVTATADAADLAIASAAGARASARTSYFVLRSLCGPASSCAVTTGGAVTGPLGSLGLAANPTPR